jgi:pyruvate/2-oxoglutarate dehydrogenase complex dihydrolipoamide acyltransferase (E2) component
VRVLTELAGRQPGDVVKADEVLAVIDTDKISHEIRAPQAGVVMRYLVDVGKTVPIGAQVVELAPGAATAAGAAAPKATPQTAPPQQPASTASASSAAAPKAAAIAPPPASGHRKPAIRFRYGKANQAEHRAPLGVSVGALSAAARGPARAYPPPAEAPLVEVPAQYRRKPLPEAAIQMIELGGAAP